MLTGHISTEEETHSGRCEPQQIARRGHAKWISKILLTSRCAQGKDTPKARKKMSTAKMTVEKMANCPAKGRGQCQSRKKSCLFHLSISRSSALVKISKTKRLKKKKKKKKLLRKNETAIRIG